MNINIKKIFKNYNNFFLEIENLYLEKGNIIGIVGANGSGKSTLLNVIANTIECDDVDILYDNNKINKEIINNMTIVFQKPYMLNNTVYKNIEYPLKIRKALKSKRKNDIKEMINKFNIEKLLNQNAKQLSGGEMQKVALARAMVFKPKILLLDEPTASIDKKSNEEIKSLITNYKNENNIIIIVTHSKEEEEMCDYIIHMEGGRVIDYSKRVNN